jgi:tetratricopeptide (TPR) repeat protein
MDEGIGLLERQRYADARALLEACARADTRDPRAAEYLGRVILAQHQDDAAVPWFERAAELAPGRAEYQLWLGRAYALQARHASFLKRATLAPKIRAAFEAAVATEPGNADARLALVDFYLLAPAILGGSVAKARVEAAEIRGLDLLKAHRAFGRIAETEREPARAAAEYDRAMEEFPARNEPVYWRASLAEAQKDWSRAFGLMEGLLAKKPDELAPCYQVGRLAAISGQRLPRGEQCLRLYLRHDPVQNEPTRALAHLQLAAILEKTSRREPARDEYRTALQLDPSLKEAREGLARLR